jgi:hypothetical protein
MRERIRFTVIGLFAGALLGILCAYLFCPAEAPPTWGWTSYPSGAGANNAPAAGAPLFWQHSWGEHSLRYWLFLGVMLGGGFGAVTGAVLSIRLAATETRIQ